MFEADPVPPAKLVAAVAGCIMLSSLESLVSTINDLNIQMGEKILWLILMCCCFLIGAGLYAERRGFRHLAIGMLCASAVFRANELREFSEWIDPVHYWSTFRSWLWVKFVVIAALSLPVTCLSLRRVRLYYGAARLDTRSSAEADVA